MHPAPQHTAPARIPHLASDALFPTRHTRSLRAASRFGLQLPYCSDLWSAQAVRARTGPPPLLSLGAEPRRVRQVRVVLPGSNTPVMMNMVVPVMGAPHAQYAQGHRTMATPSAMNLSAAHQHAMGSGGPALPPSPLSPLGSGGGPSPLGGPPGGGFGPPGGGGGAHASGLRDGGLGPQGGGSGGLYSSAHLQGLISNGLAAQLGFGGGGGGAPPARRAPPAAAPPLNFPAGHACDGGSLCEPACMPASMPLLDGPPTDDPQWSGAAALQQLES